MSLHELYGLVVDCSFALRDVPSLQSASAVPDISLTLASSATVEGAQQFSCSVQSDGSLEIVWSRLFAATVSPDGSRVTIVPHVTTSEPVLQSYIATQTLSFALVQKGIEPFHGTILERDGEAIVLLGDSGAGKSTLAAALVSRGVKLLSDDLFVAKEIDGRLHAQPGAARVKLTPEMQQALLPGRSFYSAAPYSEKVVVSLAEAHQRNPLPVSAAYLLALGERVAIAPVSPHDCFPLWMASSYNSVVRTPDRLARQFKATVEIAGKLPLFRFIYPRQTGSLSEVCDALLASV